LIAEIGLDTGGGVVRRAVVDYDKLEVISRLR
jgi:hypothetical protein